MNKKAPKKLTLSKETMRSLETQELQRAAGGFSENMQCVTGTCDWSLCICY